MRFRSILKSEFYKNLPQQGAEAAKSAGNWVAGSPLKSVAALSIAGLAYAKIKNKLAFGFLCPLALRSGTRDDWQLLMRVRLTTFVTRIPYLEKVEEMKLKGNDPTAISAYLENRSGVTVKFEYFVDDQVQVIVFLGGAYGTLTYFEIESADVRKQLIDVWTRYEIEKQQLRLYGTLWFRFHGKIFYVFPKLTEKIENLNKEELKSRFVEWFDLVEKEETVGVTEKDVEVRKRPGGGVVVHLTPSALGEDARKVHRKLLRSDVRDIYGGYAAPPRRSVVALSSTDFHL